MPAIIHHLDLYGKRQSKYDTLESLSLADVTLTELAPTAPYYFFVPKNTDGQVEYEGGFSVGELFPMNVTGIVTMGDDYIITHEKQELEKRLRKFIEQGQTKVDFSNEYNLGKNYANWIFESRENGKINELDETNITEITYRPFDTRYTYFDDKFLWRTRGKVTRHMLNRENIALILPKAFCDKNYAHAFISNTIIETILLSGTTGSNAMCLPLYLYSASENLEGTTKTPNLDATIWSKISESVGLETTPEEVLDYIYAVLHSPSYREKYKEFLKIDFPRVPYPTSRESFESLVRLGGELRGLHLLESPKVEEYITTFPVAGSGEVEKISYTNGRVYINSEQYFGDVPLVAWEFYIGGYQPAQKWLKDRKGRTLTWEDISHYQSMIVALTETSRVMGEVDKVLEV